MARLGAPSWGHVRHFWQPSWAKFGPKRVLEAYQHQKRDFSPNTTPANTGAQIRNPGWPPKCPKIAPRRLQEVLGEQLFSLLKIVLNLDAFWVRFWSILASQSPPKSWDGTEGFFVKKSFGFDIMLCIASRGSKSAQEAPRSAQEASKRHPRGPKTPLRAPKEAPRAPQEPVKRPQDPPRSPQEALL